MGAHGHDVGDGGGHGGGGGGLAVPGHGHERLTLHRLARHLLAALVLGVGHQGAEGRDVRVHWTPVIGEKVAEWFTDWLGV